MSSRLEPVTLCERRVLVIAYNAGNSVHILLSNLDGSQFYGRDEGKIYDVLRYLKQQQITPTDNLIEDVLAKRGETLKHSVASYQLDEVLDEVITQENFEADAAKVQEYAARRHGKKIVLKAAEAFEDMGVDPMAATHTMIEDAMRSYGRAMQFQRLGDVVHQQVRDYDAERTKGNPWGWLTLDAKLTRLMPTDYVLVAGLPGHGKSAFTQSLAFNWAKRGVGVLFITLEMSVEQITRRWMSMSQSVDGSKLTSHKLGPAEMSRLVGAPDAMRDLPITIYEPPNMLYSEIAGAITSRKIYGDVDVVIVDYLQHIASEGRESREETVSNASRGFKRLAKRLGLPILCVASLNKEAFKADKPGPEHIRDSSQVHYDADTILMVSRKEALMKIEIAKQRNGRIGEMLMAFDDVYTEVKERE